MPDRQYIYECMDCGERFEDPEVAWDHEGSCRTLVRSTGEFVVDVPVHEGWSKSGQSRIERALVTFRRLVRWLLR